ncbi:MAG: biopolymer transporter ExbD [Flavobacteriales bacterium]
MAEIIQGGGHEKGGKKRPKKGHVHIDMTPMVDLAFLLVTFFVLASSLTKPKVLEIVYPKEVEDEKDITKLNLNLATTLLLGKKDTEIFYYTGAFDPDTTKLILTDFSKDGFRKLMLDKNKDVIAAYDKLLKEYEGKVTEGDTTYKRKAIEVFDSKDAPFVVVKTIDETPYKNVVNALDELNICDVKKRAVQDMGESEAISVRMKSDELGLKDSRK